MTVNLPSGMNHAVSKNENVHGHVVNLATADVKVLLAISEAFIVSGVFGFLSRKLVQVFCQQDKMNVPFSPLEHHFAYLSETSRINIMTFICPSSTSHVNAHTCLFESTLHCFLLINRSIGL